MMKDFSFWYFGPTSVSRVNVIGRKVKYEFLGLAIYKEALFKFLLRLAGEDQHPVNNYFD